MQGGVVESSIVFEAVEEEQVLPALSKHNALVDNPFSWDEPEDD